MSNPRFLKYLTPAVLCFAIGLSSPLWYAARASALGLLFAVGSLIYGAISASVDAEDVVKRTKEESDPVKKARMRHSALKPIRFALGAFICSLCLLAPTAYRIIGRINNT